jgi:hypothetical protein
MQQIYYLPPWKKENDKSKHCASFRIGGAIVYQNINFTKFRALQAVIRNY